MTADFEKIDPKKLMIIALAFSAVAVVFTWYHSRLFDQLVNELNDELGKLSKQIKSIPPVPPFPDPPLYLWPDGAYRRTLPPGDADSSVPSS